MTIEPRPLTAKRRAEIEDEIASAHFAEAHQSRDTKLWIKSARDLLAALTHAGQRIAELEGARTCPHECSACDETTSGGVP